MITVAANLWFPAMILLIAIGAINFAPSSVRRGIILLTAVAVALGHLVSAVPQAMSFTFSEASPGMDWALRVLSLIPVPALVTFCTIIALRLLKRRTEGDRAGMSK